MNVYSLIAHTRSEIREVLLSISCNRPAISTEEDILTSAARAVAASRVLLSLQPTLHENRMAVCDAHHTAK